MSNTHAAHQWLKQSLQNQLHRVKKSSGPRKTYPAYEAESRLENSLRLFKQVQKPVEESFIEESLQSAAPHAVESVDLKEAEVGANLAERSVQNGFWLAEHAWYLQTETQAMARLETVHNPQGRSIINGNPFGGYTLVEYDGKGSVTLTLKDAQGQSCRRIQKTKDANGDFKVVLADGHGNVLGTTVIVTICDTDGSLVTYTIDYDANGKVTGSQEVTRDPDGHFMSQVKKDADGQAIYINAEPVGVL